MIEIIFGTLSGMFLLYWFGKLLANYIVYKINLALICYNHSLEMKDVKKVFEDRIANLQSGLIEYRYSASFEPLIRNLDFDKIYKEGWLSEDIVKLGCDQIFRSIFEQCKLNKNFKKDIFKDCYSPKADLEKLQA